MEQTYKISDLDGSIRYYKRQIARAEKYLDEHPDASAVSEELDELYAELQHLQEMSKVKGG